MNKIRAKNIFAAVFKKEVLDDLLRLLDRNEVKFWGTEGTVKHLKSKGFWAKSIVKGFDFSGRVKSLDRVNFARILADRSNKKHLAELAKLGVEPLDLVVVDLYAPKKEGFPESMDIGGQALIRAAIKNYRSLALAYDEKSLGDLVKHLRENQGSTLLPFRKRQAVLASSFIASRCFLESKLF